MQCLVWTTELPEGGGKALKSTSVGEAGGTVPHRPLSEEGQPLKRQHQVVPLMFDGASGSCTWREAEEAEEGKKGGP